MSETQQRYNAGAEQTIPLEVVRGGRRYQTQHRLGPCSDEMFIEYDKLMNIRVRVNPDKTVETLKDRDKAARYVYSGGEDSTGGLLQEVKGWGDPMGANVDDKIARMVVEEGLFVCIVERSDAEPELGDAEKEKPWEKPTEEAITLRCRFNGVEMLVKHYPKGVPSAAQLKRYEELKERRKPKPGGSLKQRVVGLQSWVKPLGKLYEELFDEAKAEGYEGRPPLWHRVEAVAAYLDSDEQTVGEE